MLESIFITKNHHSPSTPYSATTLMQTIIISCLRCCIRLLSGLLSSNLSRLISHNCTFWIYSRNIVFFLGSWLWRCLRAFCTTHSPCKVLSFLCWMAGSFSSLKTQFNCQLLREAFSDQPNSNRLPCFSSQVHPSMVYIPLSQESPLLTIVVTVPSSSGHRGGKPLNINSVWL